MPVMDGIETTRYIRQNRGTQTVIIAMTANAMVEDQEECFRAGMNYFLPKPINIESLIGLLKRIKGE
jgi:CheY-like chemotaxis protein